MERGMDEATAQQAREWYARHRRHVNQMLSVDGPHAKPSDRDPALWKAMHWRWFMAGEVAKQVGIKLTD